MKIKYIQMKRAGVPREEIYKEYKRDTGSTLKEDSFRRMLSKWEQTVGQGTIELNGNGDIVRAWVKQKDDAVAEILSAIKKETKHLDIPQAERNGADAFFGGRMLEIPLFDMHFGLAGNDYAEVVQRLIEIINKEHYAEINIVVGQDLIHNDDFRGRTTKGTQIDKIDLAGAWQQADGFFTELIKNAYVQCSKLNIMYSKGNHDETVSWCFVKMLEERYRNWAVSFDTDLQPRKVITWERVFVGITHGDAKRSSPQDLRGQFTIEHPMEFANAKCREIHAGHLHHEESEDLYGVAVRRLPSATVESEWSINSGFVGSNKRFAVCEYEPERLYAVYYV